LQFWSLTGWPRRTYSAHVSTFTFGATWPRESFNRLSRRSRFASYRFTGLAFHSVESILTRRSDDTVSWFTFQPTHSITFHDFNIGCWFPRWSHLTALPCFTFLSFTADHKVTWFSFGTAWTGETRFSLVSFLSRKVCHSDVFDVIIAMCSQFLSQGRSGGLRSSVLVSLLEWSFAVRIVSLFKTAVAFIAAITTWRSWWTWGTGWASRTDCSVTS